MRLQGLRKGDIECFRGPLIEHRLELGRLLDGKIVGPRISRFPLTSLLKSRGRILDFIINKSIT